MIKNDILNGKFDNMFCTLYGSTEDARERYAATVEKFSGLYDSTQDIRLFSAPGRTEVGGNHTDHQHGCVLAGSVNLDVIAAACRTEDNIVRIKSEGYDMDVVDLSDLSPNEKEHGKAVALIRGMLAIMRDRGYDIGGFNAYTTSNVLKGSGLSSSAAFEVLVGAIISGIFNNNTISPVEIAKIAQKSENIYFGKPCGLMDQMASAVGGFTAIDFNDPQNPVIEKVDFDLSSKDYSLCIINTGGNHADLTGDYTAITAECRAVAEFFGKSVLRDVDETEFYSKIAEMRLKLGDRAILRAIHFINDNKKAVLEKNALKNGDVDEFLRLVTASGNSSFKYLQNVFSSSIPKEQGLSLALAVSERILGGRGAHRVHGGGFAGTIQAFVPNDLKAVYLKEMGSIFGSEACYVLNIRPIGCTEIK